MSGIQSVFCGGLNRVACLSTRRTNVIHNVSSSRLAFTSAAFNSSFLTLHRSRHLLSPATNDAYTFSSLQPCNVDAQVSNQRHHGSYQQNGGSSSETNHKRNDSRIQNLLSAPVGSLTDKQQQFAVEEIHRKITSTTDHRAMQLATDILLRLELENSTALDAAKNRSHVTAATYSQQQQQQIFSTINLYKKVIRAYIVNGDPSIAVKQAEKLLKYPMQVATELSQDFEFCSNRAKNGSDKSNGDNYSTLLYRCNTVIYDFLKLCAASKHPDASKIAISVMREYESIHLNANVVTKKPPPVVLYNALIDVFVQHADREYGAAAAEDILLHLSTLAVDYASDNDDSDNDIGPNVITFNRVMQAWSQSPDEFGADRARIILELLQNLGGKRRPDDYSFATVITAYAKRCKPELSEEVCQQGLQYFIKNTDVEVDFSHCLKCCMGAWTKIKGPDTAARVQKLLSKMMREVKQYPHVKIEFDIHIMHQYLLILLHAGPNGVREAYQHLLYTIQHKEWYSHLLDERAFHQVLIGINEHCEQNVLDFEQIKGLYSAFKSLSQSSNTRTCVMSSSIYNLFIKCLCRIGSVEALVFAEELLRQAYKQEITPWLGYHVIITSLCYTGSPDAVWRAYDLFNAFQELMDRQGKEWDKMGRDNLSTVIVALCNLRNDTKACKTAIDLLNVSYDAGRNADRGSYTAILVKISQEKARSGTLSKLVEKLINQIITLDEIPNNFFQLDEFLYYAAFQAIQDKDRPESAASAITLLSHMMTKAVNEDNGLKITERCLAQFVQTILEAGCDKFLLNAASLLQKLRQEREFRYIVEIPSPHLLEKLEQRLKGNVHTNYGQL